MTFLELDRAKEVALRRSNKPDAVRGKLSLLHFPAMVIYHFSHELVTANFDRIGSDR